MAGRRSKLALKRPRDSTPIQQRSTGGQNSQAIRLNQFDTNSNLMVKIHVNVNAFSKQPLTSKVAKKIDDLEQQVLFKIFKWLDFPDLLNVANATKRLREAAAHIYTEEHANKSMHFHGNAAKKQESLVVETLNSFEINDARMCLKMLRAFGSNVAMVKLDFNGIGPLRIQAISQVLTEYCAQTLTELDLHCCPLNAIASECVKFPTLTTLRISSGHLAGPMAQFTKTFPALCKLELNRVEAENRKCIEQAIPKLTHLKVHIKSRNRMDFRESNIKAAIKLNPQINSLCFGSGCEPTILTFIDDWLPFLDNLEIQSAQKKFFDNVGSPICLKRVRNFTLDVTGSTDSFTNIPFTFKRLKKFTLKGCNRFCNKWIDFIVAHPKIVELNLLNFFWFAALGSEQVMRIAQLPKLTQLVLDWRIDSPDTLLQLLNECQSLTKLRLSVRTADERNAICSKIGSAWLVYVDDHFLRLQRNDM